MYCVLVKGASYLNNIREMITVGISQPKSGNRYLNFIVQIFFTKGIKKQAITVSCYSLYINLKVF